MYSIVKAMYAINEFAKMTRGEKILPFSECTETNRDGLYYDEETFQIVANCCVVCDHHDIISYYDNIGSGNCLYEAKVMFYKSSCDEDDEYLVKYPELLDEVYIVLCPKNDTILDESLYIYNGEVYTDDIDILEQIDNKYLG